MAIYGIEGIRNFGHYRAAHTGSKATDMTYTYNMTNGLNDALRDGGHRQGFYWAGIDCWELDLRDNNISGLDDVYVDTVDLFFINTHGNHNNDGVTHLAYNTKMDAWSTFSIQWQLGEFWQLEWMMVYGCRTINRDNPYTLGPIFQGLHIFCGSYGFMWDSITTDEVGEDVGENLTDGETIGYSWIDGVSDWAVDNNPMLLSAERVETWGGGNVDWPNTTLNRDHFWRGGYVSPDIPASEIAYHAFRWAEG